MALDLRLIEELVQKNSAVALRLPHARDVSRNPALLQVDLHELALFEEAVHPGDVLSRAAGGIVAVLAGRFALSANGKAILGPAHPGAERKNSDQSQRTKGFSP